MAVKVVRKKKNKPMSNIDILNHIVKNLNDNTEFDVLEYLDKKGSDSIFYVGKVDFEDLVVLDTKEMKVIKEHYIGGKYHYEVEDIIDDRVMDLLDDYAYGLLEYMKDSSIGDYDITTDDIYDAFNNEKIKALVTDVFWEKGTLKKRLGYLLDTLTHNHILETEVTVMGDNIHIGVICDLDEGETIDENNGTLRFVAIQSDYEEDKADLYYRISPSLDLKYLDTIGKDEAFHMSIEDLEERYIGHIEEMEKISVE